MNKTLDARFLGKDIVVLDMWYYFCAYFVYVLHVAFVMIVHMQYCAYVVCVHVVYAILCNGC